MDYQTLSNAPIKEALIDFRFELPKSFDVNKFQDLKSNLENDYPNMEKSWKFNGQININPSDKQSQFFQEQMLEGIFFKNPENSEIIQFRKNGFTFNRLKPYDKWDDFSSKAKQFWELFLSIEQPKVITRIAVRYINEIPLEASDSNYSFLRTKPLIVDYENTEVVGLLSRLQLKETKNNLNGLLTQSISKNSKLNKLFFLLDIDIYSAEKLEVINKEELWNKVESLRNYKNNIFFNTLTDETIKGFE